MIIPSVKPGPAAPAPAAAPAAPKPLVSRRDAGVRPSRLVPQDPEAGKTTFNLQVEIVTIGSEQGNDIKVGGPGVEPKHAQIAPTPNGCVITDYDPRSTARVNAEKVKERLLNNEDVVQIGRALAFRAPVELTHGNQAGAARQRATALAGRSPRHGFGVRPRAGAAGRDHGRREHFVIDLAEIGYVSSAGLRVLASLVKQLEAAKGSVPWPASMRR